ALASKADQAAVNTALSAKADKTTMDTALASKADQAAVNTALSAKADKTTMDTALASKADQAAVNTALSAKADKTTMDTALASKADQAAVNTALSAKADKTTMDTALASKADQAAVNTALSAKADKTTMDTALASKADQAAVNTALSAKADKTTMDTVLASKADQAAVNTALSGKADKTTVETSLNLKANKTDVETATTNVVRFDPAKLEWAFAHSYKAGEVARYFLNGHMYIALQDISSDQNIVPTMHPEYWALFVEGQQGTNNKLIFATKQTFDGNLGGANGADQKCQTAANESSILPSGTYKALISTSTRNASNVISTQNTYYKIDGTVVAYPFASFLALNRLNSPINMDQNGDTVSGSAWTNTNTLGGTTHWQACGDFHTGSGSWDAYSFAGAQTGLVDSTSSTWRSDVNIGCDQQARLYCVQQ
ncbi:DUF1554 domain-containing protein, partial [Pseudoalteromonas umbrosa]|uniref:DUF1554 domain-containing protein n=1 Tax=Pseudoalteromonas umbrosa TaxID=3048489 RepID=UPI0024C3EE43